jgi:hypothetical protein
MFSAFPLHHLNQLTDIHKTWNERYVSEDRPSVVANTDLGNARTYEVRATFN